MRKWSQLKTMKQKRKRLFHAVWDFLRRTIWGGYRRGGLNGLYHWIRCHVWNRYHIVNISGEDGYDWGWIDRDNVLLYASFKILKMFVEGEDPQVGLRTMDDYLCKCEYEGCGAHEPNEGLINQLARDKEIRDLYDWWTKDRPREWEECSHILDGVNVSFGKNTINVSDEKKSHSWYEREQDLHKKDEEMLIRLAKIRLCLWT